LKSLYSSSVKIVAGSIFKTTMREKFAFTGSLSTVIVLIPSKYGVGLMYGISYFTAMHCGELIEVPVTVSV
jgi:hypothetical protein